MRLDVIPLFELLDAAAGDRRNAQIGRDPKEFVARVDDDRERFAGRFDIKIGARFLNIERDGCQTFLTFGAKLDIDRQTQIVVILLDSSAGHEFPAARSDDLIIAVKFRNSRAFDPAGEKVTKILSGDLR